MHTCKFCGAEWSEDRPCEMGSDPETFEPYYCGNQECPMCYACQGRTDVDAKSIARAKEMRAMRERRLKEENKNV